MTYFLGFDVSKAKLDYSLVNVQGIELVYGKVANAEIDIATLLLSLAGSYSEGITAVAESTGTYHYALAETAYALGIPCQVYNALLTKQQTRATIRGRRPIELML